MELLQRNRNDITGIKTTECTLKVEVWMYGKQTADKHYVSHWLQASQFASALWLNGLNSLHVSPQCVTVCNFTEIPCDCCAALLVIIFQFSGVSITDESVPQSSYLFFRHFVFHRRDGCCCCCCCRSSH